MFPVSSICNVTVLSRVRGIGGLQAKNRKRWLTPAPKGCRAAATAWSPLSQGMPVTPEIPRVVSVSHLWEAKVPGWWGTIWALCHPRGALLQNLCEGDKALKSNNAATRGAWGNIWLYVWKFH